MYVNVNICLCMYVFMFVFHYSSLYYFFIVSVKKSIPVSKNCTLVLKTGPIQKMLLCSFFC